MLPDFRLEAYFSRWEFAARYHLTASDAQTMSLRTTARFREHCVSMLSSD